MVTTTGQRERPKTPTARALVGYIALRDGSDLNDALRLAGYRNNTATPVTFYRGRCYRPAAEGAAGSGRRLVTRNGRIVAVTPSALAQSLWLLKLGRKLEALAYGRDGRRAA